MERSQERLPNAKWMLRSSGPLIAAPVLFLSLVAYIARSHVDHFEFLAYSPSEQAQIDAYREPVRLVEANLGHQTDVPIRELLSISDAWLLPAREHKLQPIPSLNVDDSVADGVRGEILQAETSLGLALLRKANELDAAGKETQAADLMLRDLELAEILKLSDFRSLEISRGEQMFALKLLSSLDIRDPKERDSIVDRLTRLAGSGPQVQQLAIREQANFEEGLRREGIQPVAIVEPVEDPQGNQSPAHQAVVAEVGHRAAKVSSQESHGRNVEAAFEAALGNAIAHWSQSENGNGK